MLQLLDIISAWAAGTIIGFLVSIPVGPINVTIINEGARRGFKWALLIGLGAVAMEIVYCTVGFASFATFFSYRLIKASMELISFVLVIFLGFKYLLAHSLPATSHSADVVEEKLHPHSAFMIGFVRVLGNPAVLVFWITMAATFLSHEWVDPNWISKTVFISGVALGASGWFFLLSYTVARKHQQFSTETLLRMSHISGACLIGMGIIIGVRLILLLARH
jgi:threonine/homoserine/homoserine lactone efflux protein